MLCLVGEWFRAGERVGNDVPVSGFVDALGETGAGTPGSSFSLRQHGLLFSSGGSGYYHVDGCFVPLLGYRVGRGNGDYFTRVGCGGASPAMAGRSSGTWLNGLIL